jgi:hypothetical protein
MFPAARGPVFGNSVNSAFKWTLFNAHLAEMGSGAYRPGCDFGRTFAHHFGVVFGLVFEYFLARFSPTMEPGRMDISSFWTHRDWTRETHF